MSEDEEYSDADFFDAEDDIGVEPEYPMPISQPPRVVVDVKLHRAEENDDVDQDRNGAKEGQNDAAEPEEDGVGDTERSDESKDHSEDGGFSGMTMNERDDLEAFVSNSNAYVEQLKANLRSTDHTQHVPLDAYGSSALTGATTSTTAAKSNIQILPVESFGRLTQQEKHDRLLTLRCVVTHFVDKYLRQRKKRTRDLFVDLDKSGHGFISRKQFVNGLRKIPGLELLTTKSGNTLFREFDKDHDRLLAFDEFHEGVKSGTSNTKGDLHEMLSLDSASLAKIVVGNPKNKMKYRESWRGLTDGEKRARDVRRRRQWEKISIQRSKNAKFALDRAGPVPDLSSYSPSQSLLMPQSLPSLNFRGVTGGGSAIEWDHSVDGGSMLPREFQGQRPFLSSHRRLISDDRERLRSLSSSDQPSWKSSTFIQEPSGSELEPYLIAAAAERAASKPFRQDYRPVQKSKSGSSLAMTEPMTTDVSEGVHSTNSAIPVIAWEDGANDEDKIDTSESMLQVNYIIQSKYGDTGKAVSPNLKTRAMELAKQVELTVLANTTPSADPDVPFSKVSKQKQPLSMSEFKEDPARQISNTNGILYRAMLSRHDRRYPRPKTPVVIRPPSSKTKLLPIGARIPVDDESSQIMKKWRSEQRRVVLSQSMQHLGGPQRFNAPDRKRAPSAGACISSMSKKLRLSPLRQRPATADANLFSSPEHSSEYDQTRMYSPGEAYLQKLKDEENALKDKLEEIRVANGGMLPGEERAMRLDAAKVDLKGLLDEEKRLQEALNKLREDAIEERKERRRQRLLKIQQEEAEEDARKALLLSEEEKAEAALNAKSPNRAALLRMLEEEQQLLKELKDLGTKKLPMLSPNRLKLEEQLVHMLKEEEELRDTLDTLAGKDKHSPGKLTMSRLEQIREHRREIEYVVKKKSKILKDIRNLEQTLDQETQLRASLGLPPISTPAYGIMFDFGGSNNVELEYQKELLRQQKEKEVRAQKALEAKEAKLEEQRAARERDREEMERQQMELEEIHMQIYLNDKSRLSQQARAKHDNLLRLAGVGVFDSKLWYVSSRPIKPVKVYTDDQLVPTKSKGTIHFSHIPSAHMPPCCPLQVWSRKTRRIYSRGIRAKNLKLHGSDEDSKVCFKKTTRNLVLSMDDLSRLNSRSLAGPLRVMLTSLDEKSFGKIAHLDLTTNDTKVLLQMFLDMYEPPNDGDSNTRFGDFIRSHLLVLVDNAKGGKRHHRLKLDVDYKRSMQERKKRTLYNGAFTKSADGQVFHVLIAAEENACTDSTALYLKCEPVHPAHTEKNASRFAKMPRVRAIQVTAQKCVEEAVKSVVALGLVDERTGLSQSKSHLQFVETLVALCQGQAALASVDFSALGRTIMSSAPATTGLALAKRVIRWGKHTLSVTAKMLRYRTKKSQFLYVYATCIPEQTILWDRFVPLGPKMKSGTIAKRAAHVVQSVVPSWKQLAGAFVSECVGAAVQNITGARSAITDLPSLKYSKASINDIHLSLPGMESLDEIEELSTECETAGAELAKQLFENILWQGCSTIIRCTKNSMPSGWLDEAARRLQRSIERGISTFFMLNISSNIEETSFGPSTQFQRISRSGLRSLCRSNDPKDESIWMGNSMMVCILLSSANPYPARDARARWRVVSGSKKPVTSAIGNGPNIYNLEPYALQFVEDTLGERKKEAAALEKWTPTQVPYPRANQTDNERFASAGELSSEVVFEQNQGTTDQNAELLLMPRPYDTDSDAFDAQLISDILGLSDEEADADVIAAARRAKEVLDQVTSDREEDIDVVKSRIERDLELLNRLYARRVHRQAVVQYKAMKHAESSLGTTDGVMLGPGDPHSKLRLPAGALFRTKVQIRGGEFRMEIFHGNHGSMRITAEDNMYKKYTMETTATQVYDCLSDASRALIVENGNRTDYELLLKEVATLVQLENVRADRRKAQLKLSPKLMTKKLHHKKTPRTTPRTPAGRIISSRTSSPSSPSSASDSEGPLLTPDNNVSAHSNTSMDTSAVVQNSATVINATARGHIGRVRASIMELDLIFQNAAIDIQRIARGRFTRQNFDSIHRAFLEQKQKEKSGASSAATMDTQVRIATELEEQVGVASNKGTADDVFVWQIIKEESAVAIQSIARGKLARNRVNAMKKEIAAVREEDVAETLWNVSASYVAMVSVMNIAIYSHDFEELFNLAESGLAELSEISSKSWSNDTCFTFTTIDGQSFNIVLSALSEWKVLEAKTEQHIFNDDEMRQLLKTKRRINGSVSYLKLI
jgi:hypothetical protein